MRLFLVAVLATATIVGITGIATRRTTIGDWSFDDATWWGVGA